MNLYVQILICWLVLSVVGFLIVIGADIVIKSKKHAIIKTIGLVALISLLVSIIVHLVI